MRPVRLVLFVSILASIPLSPFAQAPAADPIRTVDVALSRFAFSPERIELRAGEPVRLNVVSTDGTHGFQIKALELKVRVPSRGTAVTIELTPREPGTYRISCSEYCGTGHSRMQAWLIVNPAP
jgi:heme/copper-type cytochrome/quinol oxidase subunit 2